MENVVSGPLNNQVHRFGLQQALFIFAACENWINNIRNTFSQWYNAPFITGNKLLFLRTVIYQEEYIPCRLILLRVITLFENNNVMTNEYDNPLVDMLNVAV